MLKVERIILKSFTGMRLHEIKSFDFTVTTDVTIILGGNGCGKTSLLSVFFPLAPSKTEFCDGGSYTNYATCGDTQYKFTVKRNGGSLVCSIYNRTTSAFLVENVNPKVYNSRVEEITGLNKEIKELLTGETPLTRATTDLRRRWFTKMSANDLSYALDVYKNLKKKASLLNGALDHTNKKIAELTTRVVETAEGREQLKTRLEELDGELKELSRAIEALPGFVHGISVEKISQLLRQTDQLADKILSTTVLPENKDVLAAEQTVQTWVELVATAEATLAAYNKELSLLLDESQRQEYLMRNHSGLKETLERLQSQLAQYKDVSWFWSELVDPNTVTLPALQQARSQAGEWSRALSGSLDEIRYPTLLKEAEETLLQLDAEMSWKANHINRTRSVIDSLAHRRSHLLGTKEVDCPQCRYRFRPGIEDNLDDIDKQIHAYQIDVKATEEALEKQQVERKDRDEDVNAKRRIREIVLSYSRDPVLAVLFKTFVNENVFSSNRDKFTFWLNKFFDELDTNIAYRTTLAQLDKAAIEWERAAKLVGNIDNSLLEKINRLQGLVTESTRKLSEARRGLEDAQNALVSIKDMRAAMSDLERLYSTIEQEMGHSLSNEAVKHLTSLRETKLDTYATARDRYRSMLTVLDNLSSAKQDADELETQLRHTRMMIQAWSPEKGVLKRYLYQSIVRITELMNRYISGVWHYPMMVLPCDITDGDLDYLFPYTLNNDPEAVPDVSKASKAQSNMFNLAYRLAAYKALQLHQYPLLLDEPSEGMDEEHRSTLVTFIKGLVNTGDYSQVLVVSHDAEVHSKLNEASYCVIEPQGVTLPAVYNEGVKIDYEN